MRQPQIHLEAPLNPSSQIALIGHDISAKVAVVGFKHKSGAPTFYHYKNVSQFQFENLRTADSPGGHLNITFKANPEKHSVHKVVEGVECDCFELKEEEATA